MKAVRKIVHPRESSVNIRVPDSFVNHDVEILVLPVETEKKSYDFSSLSGRLKWSGNALKEQRSLRDEW